MYGKRLMLAPKLKRAFEMINCPITFEIVGHAGSWCLRGISKRSNELALSKTLSFVHYGIFSQCTCPSAIWLMMVLTLSPTVVVHYSVVV